ncbi:MAG: rhodanese-related sulfurtransferase [Flavobacteriales bacterium]|nr:rhodanese-related sulfurtransferase [Flavobacteriales bacterium]
MKLHNRRNKEELKTELLRSDEKRITISFYRYYQIGNPDLFRDHFYMLMDSCGVLGRIYVAHEGINAQISVPYREFVRFEQAMESIDFLRGIRLNLAIEDDGKSFFVLKVKVRPKIVADGIEDPDFNPSNIGIHLSAEEFNRLTAMENTVLVDMRNHYESEVGHFEGAWCPDVDTFREQLPLVAEKLEEHKDKNIVMYCTGGIRCEKASAFMKYKGFRNVYQLNGGIINYARQVREKGLENRFKGKNFVFDERLEEQISEDVIAHCHQCGSAFDHHTNCKNKGCNLLFIQCPECADRYEGCCSDECKEVIHWPEEKQKEFRKTNTSGIRIFSKGRFERQPSPLERS